MTDIELGYRRVNAGVMKEENYTTLKDGKAVHNPYFVDHVEDAIKMFQDLYQDRIIGEIGDEGWAVHFTQSNQVTVSYMVDIYLDNPDNFYSVVNVIKKWQPDNFNFEFYHKGDISTYKNNK